MSILACAGSGKTTVITRRLVRLVEEKIVNPEEVVAITFTVKAAKHMKNEIVKLLKDKTMIDKIFVGTIHSFCLKMLKEHYPEISEYYKVIDADQQFMVFYKHFKAWRIDNLLDLHKADLIDRTLETINLLKTEEIDFNKIKKKYPLIFDIYEKYNKYLEANRFLDFSDLLKKMSNALNEDPKFLRHAQERAKILVIDEYQDVDRLQESIIEMINRKNLCVVGDDDQCIYQFRGTDLENILNFEEKYGAETYYLTENRRSGEYIIKLANSLIKYNSKRISKDMKHKNEGGDIKILEFEKIEEEIDYIISKIFELHNLGIPFSEMAVLLRSVSTSGTPYINALKNNGIKVVSKGDCGLFKTPEIIAISSIFEFLIQKEDNPDIINILGQIWPKLKEIATKIESIYLTKEAFNEWDIDPIDIEKIRNIIELRDRYQRSKFGSISEIFFDILNILDLIPKGDEVQLANIGEFSKIVRSFEEIEGLKKLREFVGFFTIYARRNLDEANLDETEIDAVSVLTIHQVKGLEFEVVFCPMLVEKRFPIEKDKDRWLIDKELFDSDRYISKIDDERRLFYVALTRAKKYLFISASKNIGQKKEKKHSKFFEEAKSFAVEKSITNYKPNFNPVEIEPLQLSYSQLEYYLVCPYRYKLRFKSNILPPDNPFFQYGQAIHHILKLIHEKYLNGEKLNNKDVEKIYNQNFFMRPTVPPYVIKKQQIMGLESIINYYKKYSQTFNSILYTEKDFQFIIGNDRITGRFDLIKNNYPEDIEIVDFKTGSPKEYLRSEFQMQVYALAAESVLSKKVNKCTLHYIESDVLKNIDVSKEVLKVTYNYTTKAIVGIKGKEFTATPGNQCSRCEYSKVCEFRMKV